MPNKPYTLQMIQTDKYYHRPVVCKNLSSLDGRIQLDTHTGIDLDALGYISGTFMKPVSFVSNNAAIYEDVFV